ncbi:hypothetical protein P692DRAFT_201806514 [Suillus brevipes Sb2]|nr:hypothetical protein P692DRAFT_201806514 [Suillus brevipes Sb2]
MSRTIVDIRTEVVSYVTRVYILEDSTGNNGDGNEKAVRISNGRNTRITEKRKHRNTEWRKAMKLIRKLIVYGSEVEIESRQKWKRIWVSDRIGSEVRKSGREVWIYGYDRNRDTYLSVGKVPLRYRKESEITNENIVDVAPWVWVYVWVWVQIQVSIPTDLPMQYPIKATSTSRPANLFFLTA